MIVDRCSPRGRAAANAHGHGRGRERGEVVALGGVLLIPCVCVVVFFVFLSLHFLLFAPVLLLLCFGCSLKWLLRVSAHEWNWKLLVFASFFFCLRVAGEEMDAWRRGCPRLPLCYLRVCVSVGNMAFWRFCTMSIVLEAPFFMFMCLACPVTCTDPFFFRFMFLF